MAGWVELQNLLADHVALGTGLDAAKIRWAHQNAPEPAAPYAEVAIIAQRTESEVPEERRWVQQMVEELTVQQAGEQTYRVTLHDDTDGVGAPVEYIYAAAAGLSVQQVRDAILAVLGGASNVTATASGTSKIRLVGKAAHPVFHTEVGPAGFLATSTLAPPIVDARIVRDAYTVRVQVETDSVTPAAHARARISTLRLHLAKATTREAFQAIGVAIRRPLGFGDVSAVIGDRTRSRFFHDFEIAFGLVAAEARDYVRKASASGSLTEG